MIEATPGLILTLILIGPIIIAIFAIMKNIGRWREILILTFKRPRVVCARFHTQNNHVVDYYTIPKERGVFRYAGGTYWWPKKSQRGTRYNVPVADFVELQIIPEGGKLVMCKEKVVFEQEQADGSFKTVKGALPQVMVEHSGLQAILLPLVRRDLDGKPQWTDEPPVAATEVADMIDSDVVQEINSATMRDENRERAVKLLLGITLAVVIISLFIMYTRMSNLENMLNTLIQAQQAAGGHKLG